MERGFVSLVCFTGKQNRNYMIFKLTYFSLLGHTLAIRWASNLLEGKAAKQMRISTTKKQGCEGGKVSEPSTRRQYDV